MRLLLSLIFLCILSISCINSKKHEMLFLNLIPYSNEDCIGRPDGGIGYSSIVNTCISIDEDVSNNLFKISKLGEVEIFKTKKQCNSLLSDNNKTKPIIKSKLGECISSSELGLIIDNSKDRESSYYKLTSSSKPFVVPNSYVNSFMSAKCKSDASNSIFVQYFTKDHPTINLNNDNSILSSSRYFCNENVPFIQQCFDKDLNVCSNPIDMSSVKCDSVTSFASTTKSTLKKERTSESSSSTSSGSSGSSGGETGGDNTVSTGGHATGFSFHAASTTDGHSSGFSHHVSSTGGHSVDGVDENNSLSGTSAFYFGGGGKISPSSSYKTVYCSSKYN